MFYEILNAIPSIHIDKIQFLPTFITQILEFIKTRVHLILPLKSEESKFHIPCSNFYIIPEILSAFLYSNLHKCSPIHTQFSETNKKKPDLKWCNVCSDIPKCPHFLIKFIYKLFILPHKYQLMWRHCQTFHIAYARFKIQKTRTSH